MSEGTINLRLRFCGDDVRRAGRLAAFYFANAGVSLEGLFARRLPPHIREQRRERRLLEAMRALAEHDPHLDVQVITGADGVSRVVARRLGDWGCNCEVHRERRRRQAAAAEQALASDIASPDLSTTAGDGAGVQKPRGPGGRSSSRVPLSASAVAGGRPNQTNEGSRK